MTKLGDEKIHEEMDIEDDEVDMKMLEVDEMEIEEPRKKKKIKKIDSTHLK